MSNNVFTGGILPGGLTTDYEIRMLICWLLENISQPVTMDMLNNALINEGVVNYFELSGETAKLISSNHIDDKEKNEKGQTLLTLTEKGRETALTFYKNIPLSVREKSMLSLKQAVAIEKSSSENSCFISQTENGFSLNLQISDYDGSNLLEMSFYLPTEAIAHRCKDNFLKDPAMLYRSVVKALSGEEIG